jgi:hypothetical protein
MCSNKRPGMDAGWPILLAFVRAWPRATQAVRSAHNICPMFLMEAACKVLILTGITLLFGCSNSHHLESQLLRPNGVLSVGIWSDIKGEIFTTAGATPRVTVRLGTKEEVAVEQVGNQTILYIRGRPWNRVPQESKRLDIRFEHDVVVVQTDGVILKGNRSAEPDGPADGSQPVRPEMNRTSSAAGPRR